MKSLSCKKAKKISDAYFQEILPPDLARCLESHLSACPSCRQEILETQKTIALLQSDRLPDREPEFWNGLSARIMNEVRLKRSVSKRKAWAKPVWSSPFHWPGYAWVTALILMVLTPIAIYTTYYKDRVSNKGVENSRWELRSEIGYDSLPSIVYSLSPQESARLEKKITMQMGNALSAQPSLSTEDDLRWDVSASVEGLSDQEMKALIKKLQSGKPVGFKEDEKYVS